VTGPRLWSPILDTVKPVPIPSPCFAKHPERYLHCTESPDHTGDHFHCYQQVRWPNSGSDPQW
jgi:hypothetical protein